MIRYEKSPLACIITKTDDDALARRINDYLTDHEPSNVKLIEYDGPTKWPGIHRFPCEDRKNIARSSPKIYTALHNIDRDYYANTVIPHIFQQVEKYEPFRLLTEIHSTDWSHCPIFDETHPPILTGCSYKKSLRDACELARDTLIHNTKTHTETCSYELDHYSSEKAPCPQGRIQLLVCEPKKSSWPANLIGDYLSIEIIHWRKPNDISHSIIESLSQCLVELTEQTAKNLIMTHGNRIWCAESKTTKNKR